MRLQRQDGSVAPLLAVLMSGLIVASLWGANTASLAGAKREMDRAASLSALAGAASIPLAGAFASGEPAATACRYAAELMAQRRSPLAGRLGSGAAPSCASGGITVEPLAEWSTIDYARDAIVALLGDLGLDVPDVCDPLVAPTLDLVLTTLSDSDCASLQGALDGLPDNLSPATVTPRVRVRVERTVEAPVPLPELAGARAAHAESTARRRFKNLVALPAVRIDDVTGLAEPVDDLVGGVPMPLEEIDPNDAAADVRELLLPALWQANEALRDDLAPYLPPGVTFDLGQALRDLQDLYDPPGSASPPSPVALAEEAARTGDPVVILRLFRMPVLGIPALDVTAAYLSPLADGTFRATPIPVEQLSAATGLFGAALVG